MFNSLQSSLLNNKFNLLQSCFIMISIPTHIYDVLEFHVVVFRRYPITIDACFWWPLFASWFQCVVHMVSLCPLFHLHNYSSFIMWLPGYRFQRSVDLLQVYRADAWLPLPLSSTAAIIISAHLYSAGRASKYRCGISAEKHSTSIRCTLDSVAASAGRTRCVTKSRIIIDR